MLLGVTFQICRNKTPNHWICPKMDLISELELQLEMQTSMKKILSDSIIESKNSCPS